ncbi:MAG TPA: methylated-DNA--[protein]-cysteine S-methyltransferase [candidate division Zixibacteria bacterium]|nr:methylated-DNA--[protein]-cysteine S-methyltransferase [candidate division Zixibacteria bacterium]
MSELEQRLAGAVPRTRLDNERLARALRHRAASEGLLDVAYATLDTPLGELLVAVTPRGVVRVAYPGPGEDVVLEELAARVSPRVLRAPERTDELRRQLEEYFARRRRSFEVPVDWSLIRGFARGVLEATAAVPFGSVTTYRDVAAAAGSPRAYRAAGNALGANPVPIVVPCHRVLHSGGELGGYAGGLDRKRMLLTLEGVLPG